MTGSWGAKTIIRLYSIIINIKYFEEPLGTLFEIRVLSVSDTCNCYALVRHHIYRPAMTQVKFCQTTCIFSLIRSTAVGRDGESSRFYTRLLDDLLNNLYYLVTELYRTRNNTKIKGIADLSNYKEPNTYKPLE